MLYESPSLTLAAEYGIATLTLRQPLHSSALSDFEAALSIVARKPGIDVLILTGDGSECDGPSASNYGQLVARRLADLDAVTLAVMEGPWIGGSLELALACDYRLAVGSAETRLGFPQIRAGRPPCWGATVRLPRRIGVKYALELLLSGKKVSAAQALQIGLVNRAVGPRLAAVQREQFALELQRRGIKSKCNRQVQDCFPWRREILLARARRQLREQVSPDHHAIWSTLAALTASARGDRAEALAEERRGSRRFDQSITARRPALRVVTRGIPASKPGLPSFRIGIMGAGTIGSSLAQWFSLRGCAVLVHDIDPEAARERVAESFEAACRRRLLHRSDARTLMEGITFSDAFAGFDSIDLAIEAVDESKNLKRWVLHQAEQVIRRQTLLATTTTAFSVGGLQKVLSLPERLVGLHIGHPATSLRYVELAAGPLTDAVAMSRVRNMVEALGKFPIVVADRPGRVLGCVLLPYFHEAILVAEEGVGIDALDAALRRFGLASGPFQVMDSAGLDTVRATMARLKRTLGPRLTPPPLLDRLVENHHLGRKTGAGFYSYGRKVQPHFAALPPQRSVSVTRAAERVLARLLRAASRVVHTGVTRDLNVVNSLLFDAGWPTFRGGPLRAKAQRRAA